ncbi:MAG: DMT family transporter [Holophaga sp.]|jgi:drug/metabolite transporter (DMT)-like permease
MPYLGEIASFFTAMCWSANAVLFAKAGRRVGSSTVNVVRLGVALVVMVLLHLAILGTPFPFGAGPARMAWLGISGLIGFALGDALLFEAYILLGARMSVLIFTLWPVFAAVMAWAFLGQRMGLAKAGAMVVTLAGIAMVVGERGKAGLDRGKPRRYVLGLALALGGAAGQAVGFILSKIGMAGGFSPISANLIRVCAGGLALWTWRMLRGELLPDVRRLTDRKAALFIGLGALFGPVAGVVLSLYAINHARYLGVASTIMSLSPVLLLPYSVLVDKERVGLLAVAGTFLSIGGAAGLFLL